MNKSISYKNGLLISCNFLLKTFKSFFKILISLSLSFSLSIFLHLPYCKIRMKNKIHFKRTFSVHFVRICIASYLKQHFMAHCVSSQPAYFYYIKQASLAHSLIRFLLYACYYVVYSTTSLSFFLSVIRFFIQM